MSVPNIIFCMCDELRWCEVGCYGHPTIRTPHLDRLASQGTRFEVGISNAPICMPARSVLLSGQHARSCCGMFTNAGWPKGARFDDAGFPQWPTGPRNHLPDATLPELLKQAGYDTLAVGKWHIEAWPDKIGFDHYLIPAHHHANSAQWYCRDGQPLFSPPGFGVDYEVEQVGEFFRSRRLGDAPFFLYYNLCPPHMPLLDAPERYLRMYRREDVVVRANVDLTQELPRQTQQFLTYLWDYRYYRDKLPYTTKLPHEHFDLIDLTALYMGLTTWVDDTVGRMLAYLDEAGLAENTIVVFTSDHGDNLGSWQQMGKGLWRDESARVPMLVRGPGVKSNQVTHRVGSLVDWAPTFLAFAGVEQPGHMQGRSLKPTLEGASVHEADNHVIIESQAQGVALRGQRYLLGIPWTDPTRRDIKPVPSEFFDLQRDPYALMNRLGDPELSVPVQVMSTVIQQYHQQTPYMHFNGLVCDLNKPRS